MKNGYDSIEAWGGPLDGRRLPVPWGEDTVPVDHTTGMGRCTGTYKRWTDFRREVMVWVPGTTILFKQR